MRIRLVVLLALLASLFVPLELRSDAGGFFALQSASAAENPFHVEVGSATIPAGGRGSVEILVVVPEGHHVYRDMMDVAVPDPGSFKPGKARFPKGILEDDPATPGITREIFHQSVRILLPIAVPATVKPGAYDLDVEVSYQGCKSNLCFMPQRDTLPVAVKVTEAVAKSVAAAAADLPAAVALVATEPPSAALPSADPPAVDPPSGPRVDMSVFGPPPVSSEVDPVAVRAVAGGPGEVLVGFFEAEGWHVNRALTSVEAADPAVLKLGEQAWPTPTTFHDPVSDTDREEISGSFAVRVKVPAEVSKVALVASFQACRSTLCLMPKRVALTVDLAPKPSSASGAEASAAPPAAAPSSFENARSKGRFWLLAFVFGAGFLVSLTPCVLPMVPVTMGIIGAQAGGGKVRALALSAAYVLGLVLVYTALGVAAALTGSMFGAWMQSPWVVGAVAIFFFAMGLAMFGVFDVAAPAALTNRLSRVGGTGFLGAFVVGMVGALVAGPCSGPVIASLMVLIGQQGHVAEGAILMGTFSLGMGMIFLVAGVFSTTLLRPGAWMETVRQAFGVIMWLGAIWFVHAHLPQTVVGLLIALVLLGTAVFGWPRPGQEDEEGWGIVKSKRLYAVVAGIVGGWILVTTLAAFSPTPPSADQGASPSAQSPTGAAWQSDEKSALALASQENRPVLVDFGAEWCAACKEIEHKTYTDPAVVALFSDFVLLRVDATSSNDPEVKRLVEKYHVTGLPSIFFLKPNGALIPDLTLLGYEEAAPFQSRLKKALEAAGR
jgi:thioredoxin:protein disulfide reductase